MRNEMITKIFKGNKIGFKVIDGIVYANANKMAEAFGGSVALDHWKRSENTKRYITALENSANFTELKLMKIKEGRTGGTWIHEKLVLNFARYLDVNFELWCDEVISSLIREGKIEIDPKEALKKKRADIMEMNAKARHAKQLTGLIKTTKSNDLKEYLICLTANYLLGEDVVPLPAKQGTLF